MIKALDFLALFLYCALIYWLSAQSDLPIPEYFPNQDKTHHIVAYFVMALLAWRFFRHFSGQGLLLGLSVIGFCSLYGMSDEWHQSFVEGRVSDIFDWLADTFGAVLGVVFIILPRRLRRARVTRIK